MSDIYYKGVFITKLNDKEDLQEKPTKDQIVDHYHIHEVYKDLLGHKYNYVTNYTCWCCGKTDTILDRAHIIPKQAGGGTEHGNFVLLCNSCHWKAPDMTDPECMFDWITESKTFLELSINKYGDLLRSYNTSGDLDIDRIVNILEGFIYTHLGVFSDSTIYYALKKSMAILYEEGSSELSDDIVEKLSYKIEEVISNSKKKRQTKGVKKAKDQGKYKGRKPDLVLQEKIKTLLLSGSSIRGVAKEIGCSTATVHKVKKSMEVDCE